MSGSIAVPYKTKAKRAFRLSYLMYSVLILLVLVLVSSRIQPWLCTAYSLACFTPPSTSPGGNGAFTEDFHNNDRNWTIGTQDNGHLMADINGNHQYTLTIDNVQNTYFPHPAPMGTNSGPLPQNFTLTAKMAQTSGGIYNLFGLALRVQGDDQHVSSYVFAIKLAGHYQLLKYASNTESLVKEGLASINDKLNQVNTLKVIVRGHTFLLYVNDQLVQLQGTADHSFSDNDHPFTGGQLGIYVTGPDASFAITSVVLTANS